MFIKFILSFLLSYSLYKLILPILNHINLDFPNNRSSHKNPTPTSGGIVFSLFLFFTILLDKEWILLSFIPLVIVGFIDDRFDVPSLFRFIIQTFSSFFIVYNSDLFYYILHNNYIYVGIIFGLFLLLSVALINFFNFFDGIDGLLSSCTFIIFLAITYSSTYDLSLILGSIFAFIFFNWYPARLFMGDVGSTLLGGIFAFILLDSTHIDLGFRIILLATPILGDTISCLIRRILDGQNIFSPHDLHLYQRLIRSGMKPSNVSLIYTFSTFYLSISFLYLNTYLMIINSLIILCIGYLLDLKYAEPFKTINSNH